jgi:hypothetical protein
MKNLYKSLLLMALFSLATLGCKKKYDYHFDNGYDNLSDGEPSGIDTADYSTDRSMFAMARIFPGLVSDSERRIQDTVINFDMSVPYIPAYDIGVLYTPLPLFSTGLYAGPGELVKITVPDGIQGLSVQVGSQSDNVSNVTPARRDGVISTVQQLFPGNNYVRNLYGGYIWLKYSFPLSTKVSIRFKNVVKAADYVLGANVSNKDWQEEVKNSGVPWLELRSKHTAFSVPRSLVLLAINNGKLDSVDILLKEWDHVFEDYVYDWAGLLPNAANMRARAPQLPERFVMDIQPLDSVFHTGQPIVSQMSSYWLNQWLDYGSLKNGVKTQTFTNIENNYYNNAIWWSTITPEISVDMLLCKIAKNNNRIPDLIPGGSTIDTIQKSIDFVKAQEDSLVGINFSTVAAFKDPVAKLTPFLQLFGTIKNPTTGDDGWSFLPYLLNMARNVQVGSRDIEKISFFFTSLCDYTHKDFYNFFRAWGLPVSTVARSQVMHKYPPLSEKLWEYNPITKEGGNSPVVSKRTFIDRINWTVFASSEANNEGAYNTKDAIVDGDPTTYWHSCYDGCNPPDHPLPFILEIDMKQVNRVSGFYIASRMGGRRVRSAVLSVSNDGLNWTDNVATFAMQNRDNDQFFALPQVMNFRYFKLTLPEPSYDSDSGNPLDCLSEVGAFIDN